MKGGAQRRWTSVAVRDLRGLNRCGLVASRTHKLRFTRGSLFSSDQAPKLEERSLVQREGCRFQISEEQGYRFESGRWIPPVTRRCPLRNGWRERNAPYGLMPVSFRQRDLSAPSRVCELSSQYKRVNFFLSLFFSFVQTQIDPFPVMQIYFINFGKNMITRNYVARDICQNLA